jgi:hypothetical protein
VGEQLLPCFDVMNETTGPVLHEAFRDYSEQCADSSTRLIGSEINCANLTRDETGFRPYCELMKRAEIGLKYRPEFHC